MEIRLYKEDLKKLLQGKEFSHVIVPIGTLKIYDFQYDEGKLWLLLDYPLKKSIRCSFQDFMIEGDFLKCECNIENTMVKTMLKLARKIPALLNKGIDLQYPHVSIDISKIKLPITPQEIECFNDEVRIVGELNK